MSATHFARIEIVHDWLNHLVPRAIYFARYLSYIINSIISDLNISLCYDFPGMLVVLRKWPSTASMVNVDLTVSSMKIELQRLYVINFLSVRVLFLWAPPGTVNPLPTMFRIR